MLFRPTKPNNRVRHICWRLVPFSSLLSLLLLAACGSRQPTPTPIPATPTPAPATATTAPTAAPVATATDAPAQADSPLQAPAVQAESPLASPPTGAPSSFAPEHAAFVRGGVLYIQHGPDEAEIVPVEDCSAEKCFIYHLDWSPAGDHLLYYVGSYDGTVPHQIRLADAAGVSQRVTDQAAYVQPAAWSPDSTAIVYRTDTDRYAEVTDGPAMRIQEVWTVDVTADGALGEPELRGEVTFGEGCGGGGRSESANAYEREGGFAYGYLSGVMAWTPADILLFTDNCTTRGVSRFDLANNVELDAYPGALRSLSLNGAGDAWVAINDDNSIVTGTPTSLETSEIPSSAAPELVVYGKHTGTIYYTTLEITGGFDLVEQASATLDPAIPIFAYFDTTAVSLVALDLTASTETILLADDGYAYARIAELAEGGIIFTRVEDNAELQAAVENEELTVENWRNYLPTVDVLFLMPESNEATLYVGDAAQYTLAQ